MSNAHMHQKAERHTASPSAAYGGVVSTRWLYGVRGGAADRDQCGKARLLQAHAHVDLGWLLGAKARELALHTHTQKQEQEQQREGRRNSRRSVAGWGLADEYHSWTQMDNQAVKKKKIRSRLLGSVEQGLETDGAWGARQIVELWNLSKERVERETLHGLVTMTHSGGTKARKVGFVLL